VRLDNRTEPLANAVKRLEKVKARSVLVRAERSVKHQSLISAIDALQKAGVRRISVAVREEQAGKDATWATLLKKPWKRAFPFLVQSSRSEAELSRRACLY